MGRQRFFLPIVLAFVIVLAASSPAFAPPPSMNGYGMATIDGNMELTEWGNADSTAFDLGGGYTGTLYVMNDATNLYLGVTIADNTLEIGTTYSDRVEFSFDNDNDGSGPITENGDDYLYGFGNALEDSFYSLILVDDDDAGGTNDGSSLASHGVGYNHFELGHPLDSADDAHDFSLHFGDIVGFNMVYYYGGEASGAYTTGYFTGSIEIISPPPTCTISVEPETTVVTVGDEFEVKVWIRSVEEGMDWFRFIVAWDTTQLELVEKQVPTVSGWGNGASEYVGQNPLIHFLDVSGGTTVSPIYSDEFWLTIKFKCLASGEAQITLPLEITSSDFTAYERDVWHDHTTDVMFDVTASNGVAKQRAPTTPSNPGGYVGGDVFAANKISVLAPYLIGIISVVAVAAVVIKRRRD